MTRARRPRARTEPDALTAFKAGLPIEYSQANWSLMLEVRYFASEKYSLEDQERARDLLRAWRDQYEADLKARRLG